MEGMPIFSYKEIIELGQESHKAFSGTDGKLMNLKIDKKSVYLYYVMNHLAHFFL